MKSAINPSVLSSVPSLGAIVRERRGTLEAFFLPAGTSCDAHTVRLGAGPARSAEDALAPLAVAAAVAGSGLATFS